MDFILATLYVFLPLILARNSLNLKKKYQDKIEIFDDTFSNQFSKLTRLKTIDGIDYLGTIFGVSFGIIFVLHLISQLLFKFNLGTVPLISWAFSITLIGWVSIKWYTQPKKFSLDFLKNFIQFSALILFFPIIDLTLGIKYTEIPYSLVLQHGLIIGIELPKEPHVIMMAIIMMLYMQISMLALWAAASIILAFFFIPLFTISYFVLMFCSISEKMLGKYVFNSIIIVLIIITQYYSWYKG